MRKTITIVILFAGITTKAQILGTNLVNNPSFEEYDTCPNTTNEMDYAQHWWGYSDDYYNSCSITMNVPNNGGGILYAHTGVAYAGFILYANYSTDIANIRESIKSILIKPLEINKRYCAKFFISLANYAYTNNWYVELDSIGMLFSQNQIQDTNILICNNCPQVNKSISLLDTANWLGISGDFIANGGEQYIAISNFQDIIHWPAGEEGFIYVYVDDVSVCECSFNFSLGNDTTLCNGETLQLKVSMPNATYTWQDGSTDSIYKVTHAGTYWVKAYFADYNITTYDTINIMYKDCEDTLVIPNIFTPNGDNINDYFVIKNSNDWNINVQVFNRWGVLVYEDNNYQNNWGGKSKGKDVSDGVYYYVIKAKGNYSGNEKQYHGSLTILR